MFILCAVAPIDDPALHLLQVLRKLEEFNGRYGHELPEMNGHSCALGLGAYIFLFPNGIK